MHLIRHMGSNSIEIEFELCCIEDFECPKRILELFYNANKNNLNAT